MKKWISGIAALAFSCAAYPQTASQNYPSRPVMLIISTAAGGPNDIEVRNYLPKMSAALGQPFVMDFKAGAGTTVGAAYVAKARADGHTLLVATASMTTFPALYKDLPFDIVKDFEPVVQMSERSNVLIVTSSFAPRTFGEYIAYARSNSGKVNFGTSGAGQAGHLAGAWLHSATGTEVTFVPYKGTPPLIVDLVAGRVQVSAAVLSGVMPLIKSGKVRPLAIMGAMRSKMLPDLATVAESGLPGYDYSGWLGFVSPKGTPTEVVTRLNRAFVNVSKAPEVIAAIESGGGMAIGSTSEHFRNVIVSETQRWQKVINDTGIVLEN